MFHITIDTRKLIEPYLVDRDSIRFITERLVEGVTKAMYYEILEQSSDGLSQTRAAYARGLNEPIFGPLKGTIVLTGSLPNMIEQGASGFDMKQGMLASAKAKQGKNGKYLTIPFRWGAPGSVGESEAFSNIMPTEIHSMLKSINASKTTPFGGGGISGSSLNVKGTKYGGVLTRGAFQSLKTRKVFGAYTHKSPLAQGIKKASKKYENAMGAQYMSFRRVSLASDKNSWVHPGLTARNFFDKAYESLDLDTLEGQIVDEHLKILGI